MLKKFLLPALLGLLGVGLLIMAVTGMLDTSPGVDFVQGEMDGTRIDISAKFSARVQDEVGKDGAPVQRGDLLLVLDGKEMRARVRQAEEELRRAQATLEKLHNGTRQEEVRQLRSLHDEAAAALVLARQTYDRRAALHRERAVSTQARDEALNTLKSAVARERKARAALEEAMTGARDEDISAAEAEVRALEAHLAEVTSMAEDIQLRSPISGEISKMLVKKGELVSAGYSLVTLVDLSDLWAVVLLREDQLAKVRMGQVFTARVPALDNRAIAFKVDCITPLGNFATWRATNDSASYDLKTFEVHARPVKPEEGLRPGMSVVFPRGQSPSDGSRS